LGIEAKGSLPLCISGDLPKFDGTLPNLALRKRTTIRDIAKELNTTAATVSRALNDNPSISEGMKTNVRLAAERLNYRPDKVATSLRSGRTFVIGVIIPSAEISFFGSVVHGIEQVARNYGYHILLSQSNERYINEKEGINTFLQSNVDCIMASIAKETTNYDHFQEVKERNIPLIFFDRGNDELGVPSVVIDDYKGAYLATQHLLEQGYRRIAHITGLQHIKIFKDRLKGYRDALRDHHITFENNLVTFGDVSIESGKACTADLLKLKNPPDAIFAAEDFTALGALQTLKSFGLQQPGKFGLVGFANEAFGEFITPSLTTIDQKNIRMGEETAKLFISLLAKKQFYASPPQKLILEPQLIVRESSSKKS